MVYFKQDNSGFYLMNMNLLEDRRRFVDTQSVEDMKAFLILYSTNKKTMDWNKLQELWDSGQRTCATSGFLLFNPECLAEDEKKDFEDQLLKYGKRKRPAVACR